MIFFIIQIWQKQAVLQVFALFGMVAEVIRRANGALYYWWIRWKHGKTGDFGLELTPRIFFRMAAVFLKIKSVVGSTYCHKISYWYLKITTLNYKPPNKTTLAEPEDVELLFAKNLVSLKLITGFFALFVQSCENWRDSAVSDFYTLNVCFRTFGNLFDKPGEQIFFALLFYAVKNHGWNRINYIWS